MAWLFILYIAIYCRVQPERGPALSEEARGQISRREKLLPLKAGIAPLFIFTTPAPQGAGVLLSVVSPEACTASWLTQVRMTEVLRQGAATSHSWLWRGVATQYQVSGDDSDSFN
jgi:hypothetical protein